MLPPTAIALFVLVLVILTQDLLGYTDLVINRGLGAGAVARIALYQTFPLVAMTLPFAVAVGCLTALGRLAVDGELLAIEANGLSGSAVIRPVSASAGAMTLVALALTLFTAPWANRSLDASLERLGRERPGARIRAGTIQRFGDWKLEAREASAQGDRMRGVMLWVPELGETLFAERGELLPASGGETQIELDDGLVIPNANGRASEIRFEHLTTRLPEAERPIERDAADRIGGARLGELSALGRSPDAGTAARALIELHRRFALPAAALLFGVLAVPLALGRAHLSRSGGAVTGILATLAYYALVQLGDGLIQEQVTGVALGVWLPDLTIGALALLLVLRLLRKASCAGGFEHGQRRRFRFRSGRRTAATERPPRRWPLQRYIAGSFATTALVGLGALLIGYLLVDVLERLSSFARFHASGADVLRYYSARLPLLASRVMPMALLLAAAIGVGRFAARNELVAMEACGLPLPRKLIPIPLIGLLVVPLHFLLNDAVLPHTNALAGYIKNVRIRGLGVDLSSRAAMWYRAGDYHYQADLFDPDHGVARNIVVYQLGPNGLPTSRIDAREARYIGAGVWRLTDPSRVEIQKGAVVKTAASPFAQLGKGFPQEIETSQLSVGELRREIRTIAAAGYDSTPYQVDLVAKLTGPLACAVLPTLALLFAISGPPYPRTTRNLVFGVLVAATYVLFSGVSRSLGYGGVWPPLLAGTAPLGLLVLVALFFAWRLRAVRG